MVKCLGIDTNNDLYLTSQGNIAMLDGIEAVAAGCKIAAQTQKGELIYQQDLGLPNFSLLWQTGKPNLRLWEKYLETALRSVSGVKTLQNVTVKQVGDAVTYTAVIVTDYGVTNVNMVI